MENIHSISSKADNTNDNAAFTCSTGPAGAGKQIEGILATCMDANIDGIPTAFKNFHKMRFAGGTIPKPGTCPQIDNSIRVATTDNLGINLIHTQKMVIVPHGFCKSTRMALQGLVSDTVLETAKQEKGITQALTFDEATLQADAVARHSAKISLQNAKLYGFVEENLQSCFFNYFTDEVLLLDKKSGQFRSLDEIEKFRIENGAVMLQRATGIDPELLERLLEFKRISIAGAAGAEEEQLFTTTSNIAN